MVAAMPTNIAEQELPTTPAARRAWIKFQLELRGLTLGALARKKRISRKTVQKALHFPYPKSERLIARALGLQPQQIWPERYGADGKSNRRRGRPPVRRLQVAAGARP
jgi:Ner family transcriptional regulator